MKCEISADRRLEREDMRREKETEGGDETTLNQHAVRHPSYSMTSLAWQRRRQGKRAAAQIVLLSMRR